MLYPNITRYIIVDLGSVLKLARQYLSKALPTGLYHKLIFVTVDDFNKTVMGDADLVLNINSMQEMSEAVVLNYLSFISKQARYFYSKNTVGKFAPELCGFECNEKAELALSAGLCTQEVNIFCPDSLKSAQTLFMDAFKPGEDWDVLRHTPSKLWTHYYQVLYKKN